MSTTYSQLSPSKPKLDVAIALVGRAWEEVCLASGRAVQTPIAIVPIKPHRVGRKSGVYRLDGAGDGGSAIVAKRCARATGVVERDVYERILPHVDVPALRYYGYLEELATEFSWLFIGYAGEAKLANTDGALAAQWLARLHTGAAPLLNKVPLPDRGPAHYLEHLRVGRRIIGTWLVAEPGPADAEDLHALRALQALSERLESRWESVCSACATAPRTLVHGDFSRKNLRLRNSAAGAQLVALDWETAGWGPPAADLPYMPTRAQPRQRLLGSGDKPPRWDGTVPLEEYASCGSWGRARMRDLKRLARLGTVFRAVAGIRWAAEQLSADGTQTGMRKLRWYAELLPRALDALGRS
jgi:Phosphotransferase enzyme family